ncbi:hypothetical protein QVN42_15275 [Yersinia nurmii]|uniref:Cytolethal distending toxin A/C family n=1 Tax=Yersinia nurmii TaxID=685706 RepID=A0AAW7K1V0_9GAMM|nr:hypothetical protein [Yersinia nurmii]MDN0088716.1 hypothetical protein [Yersinia nurmii]CNE94942.1 Cytolethal distending toxin A/C family [Yersinia nurmii]
MNKEKPNMALMFIVLLTVRVQAEDNYINNIISQVDSREYSSSRVLEENNPAVSLYNIGSGTLLYSYEYKPKRYLSADYAYNLNGRWNENANWHSIYNRNGTVSFKNIYSGLCLQHYGTEYQVIENTCDPLLATQQINLELVSSGGMLMRFNSNNECLYIHPGVRHYYVYSDKCEDIGFYHYWTIIPPLNK